LFPIVGVIPFLLMNADFTGLLLSAILNDLELTRFLG